MKNLSHLILILLMSVSILTGQNISENTLSMSQGSKNAITIEVRDGDSKFVEKEWKDYMKLYGKLKKVKKSKDMVAENIRISDILGTENFQLYSQISAGSAGLSKLSVWIEKPDGSFLSSSDDPDAYAGLTDFLMDFEFTARKNRVATEVEEQEKLLGKYDSDLEKLKKENKKLHDTIEKAREAIAKAEQDIVTNLASQEEAARLIESQKGTVSEVKEKYNSMKKSGN